MFPLIKKAENWIPQAKHQKIYPFVESKIAKYLRTNPTNEDLISRAECKSSEILELAKWKSSKRPRVKVNGQSTSKREGDQLLICTEDMDLNIDDSLW